MEPHLFVCPLLREELGSRTDDVMKSPSIKDKRALRLCNPLTFTA